MRNFSVFGVLIISGLLLFTKQVTAQLPVSGTKTICPSGCNFPTLTRAFDTITTNGLGGAVVLELKTTYVSTSETFPLTPSTNGTASNTITIRPEAAVSSALSITSNNANSTLLFNGAQYISFDGRNGGTGTNRFLTISNTNTSDSISAIRFRNAAINNTIMYCTVTARDTAVNSAAILFSTSAAISGNDNNMIDNCSITNGTREVCNAIASFGSPAFKNTGNIISNNLISTFIDKTGIKSTRVHLDTGSTQWTIANNKLFSAATLGANAGSLFNFIDIVSGGGYTITGNIIGYANEVGSGLMTYTGAGTFKLINLVADASPVSSIQNNTLAGITISSSALYNTVDSSFVFCAIYIGSNTSANIGTSIKNTIGNMSTIGSLSFNFTANNAAAIAASGIYISGPNCTISNNEFGGIRLTSTNRHTGLVAINNAAVSGTTVMSNNIVGSATNSNITVASTVGELVGILSTKGSCTISGNQIRNLTHTGANTGSDNSCSVIGIHLTNTTTGGQTIDGNTIERIGNSNAGNGAYKAIALRYQGPSVGTNTLKNNVIRRINVEATGITGEIEGIRISAGTTTIHNNMIAVGTTQSGGSITKPINIRGINEIGGNNSFYFNSVYVHGTSVLNNVSSFAYFGTTTTGTRDFKNNSFFNNRSFQSANSGIGNYAFGLNGTITGGAISGLSLDYNLYQSGEGTPFRNPITAGTDYISLASWKAVATSYDANSIEGNPLYNSRDFLKPLTGTPLMAGTAIGGITTDIEGITRGINRMGSYENIGEFAPPDIGHIGALKTILTTDRVLTARIRDTTGVPVVGINVPRLYYKKNSLSYQSVAGTLSSGTGKDGVWSFTLSSAAMGGLTIGDTVNYYIIAQDTAVSVFVASNPEGVVASSVNSITAAPINLNSYLIVDVSNNLYTICDTCDFRSLTETGGNGLFEALNNSLLSANLEVYIYQSTSETGASALNGDALGGFKLSIRPGFVDSVFTISNSSNITQPLIRLNGVSKLTIDGSFNGFGRNLRFINTNTTEANCQPVILFDNTSTFDTLKNCILENNATNAARYTIVVGQTGSQNNIVVSNNLIRGSIGSPGTAATLGTVGGILCNSVSNNTITIGGPISSDGNEFTNFSTNGVFFQATGDNIKIQNNKIYRNLDRNGSSSGVTITNGNGHIISNNSIGGNNTLREGNAFTIRGTSTLSAISVNVGIATRSFIQNNTLSNLGCANHTDVTAVNGILINGGLVTVSENIIGGAANSFDTLAASGTGIGINCAGTAQILATIRNNEIANFSEYRSNIVALYGVSFSNTNTASTFSIVQNTIRNLKGNSTSTGDASHPIGIYISANNATNTIDSNSIHSIENTQSAAARVAGIRISTAAGQVNVSRNKVYGLTQPNQTGGYAIWGLLETGTGNVNVINNMVSISVTNGAPTISGHEILSSAGTHNQFFNNIYIGGSAASGAAKSYAFNRSASPTNTNRNNIYYNERTGGSGGHFSTGLLNNTTLTISNNVMVASTANVGEYAAVAQTFSAFNTASGQTNSRTGLNTNYASNRFFTSTATANLMANNCLNSNGGTVVTTTTDFMGITRSATTPDIGANEFAPLPLAWTGSTSTDFNNGSNWCSSVVPTSTDTFVVPVVVNQPLLTANTTIHTAILNSGSVLSLGSNTLTINGRLSGIGVIRGSSASSITISGNGVMDTLIMDPSTPGTTNTLNTLTVSRGSSPGTGSVFLSNALNISESLSLMFGTLNTNNNLTLLSTVLRTANILPVNTSNTAIVGNLTAQRFISSQSRRYRFLASPVSGTTIADWKNEIHITGPGTGNTVGTENSNGFDATLASLHSSFWYNESDTGSLNNGWTGPTSKTESIAVGRGYRVFVRGPRSAGNGLLDGSISSQAAVTIDLTGEATVGNVSLPVTFTSNSSANNIGWCLLGNPYASAINWNSFHDAGRTGSFPDYSGTDYSHLSPVVYVFSPISNKYESYNANSDTGTLTSGIIPSGAAFFVVTKAASPTMTMKESYKTVSAPISLFKSTPVAMSIKLYADSSENDIFLFKPIQDAAPILDGYDIVKLNNPNVNISSIGIDGQKFTLDCRPLESEKQTIPLSIKTSKTGTFFLDINGVHTLDYDIWLKDNFNNSEILLKNNQTLSVNITNNENSSGDNRLALVFNSKKTTGTAAINVTKNYPLVALYPNPVLNELNIAYTNNTFATFIVKTCDVFGKEIMASQYPTSRDGLLKVNVSSLVSGIYYVSVYSENGALISCGKIAK